ncbi:DUF5958 family protein [Streptomyces sp. CB02400]|uniref:DUF5958 family protein n=1 Tax=Streptomyces sp. CB02400 TaxID=1703944 RepID=UPI00095BC851|nr:hypothetical protein AMK33_37650 [Streptomyces sp. CB02400]
MTEPTSDDGRTFRRETERVVNEIAQGLRTLDAGVSWFSDLAPTRQQMVLQEVAGYAMQAHITAADDRAGVARSGVKTMKYMQPLVLIADIALTENRLPVRRTTGVRPSAPQAAIHRPSFHLFG